MPTGSKADVVIVASYGDSLVTFRGELLRQMRARNRRVLALAPELTPATREWLTQHGIEFREAPLGRTATDFLSDARFLLWLHKTLREASPTVVLAYTVKPVIYGMLASRTRNTRRFALITGLGYSFTDGTGNRKPLRALIEVLYRISLRRADGVFFHNLDDEALFRQRRLLPRGVRSIVLTGSGIDLEAFNFVSLLPGPMTFLLIGRLLGDKGIREYVSAARMLKRKYAEVIFQLVGWIDTNPDAIRREELEQWIAEGFIQYLGRLDDVQSALARCTVYVLPSYREGTPRTVLEAMAKGRPIITTNAPGCRETVVDGENGFLVPVRSVSGLADAMERFIREPKIAAQMGRRSRELAEQKYDVHKVNSVMMREMGLLDLPSRDHSPKDR